MTTANLARMRQLGPWALVIAGAAVAVGAYLQALHYLFLSDDTVYITENTRLAGLHFTELWRLFVEPYNRYSEFLPLRDLSYWLEMKLFGLNSAAFRVDNIILYLLCLPLVYANTAGLWRYFRPADIASAPWAAGIVTALFALQPSHAEAVVWISGRKDVLSTLFSLLAIWFAIRAKREQGLCARYALATLIAFVAVMLTKVLFIALAPVIALLWLIFWRDIPDQQRSNSTLLWPLLILLLAGFMASIFMNASVERASMYFGIEAVIRTLAVMGWLTRLAVSPESRHFLYPVFEDPFLPTMVTLGAAVLLAALVAVLKFLRRNSLEGFALLAFLLLCLPYIHLIPYQPPSLVSDRWLALAAWPSGLLIVVLAWRLKPVPRTVLLLVIAFSWGIQTIERSRDWRSLEALLDADIRAFPGFYLPAGHKIIDVQLKNGLRSDALMTAKSITDLDARNIMIELIRTDYVVKVTSAASRNPQEAMTQLWSLEQDINPPAQIKWNSAMRNFWGSVASALMQEWIYLAMQFPDASPVHYNAGLWMLKIHKYEEAVMQFRAASESRMLPDSSRGNALYFLGLGLIGSGDVAAAEVPLRAALEQSPPDYRAYCALSDVYQRTGRPEEAARAAADCRTRVPAEGMAQ